MGVQKGWRIISVDDEDVLFEDGGKPELARKIVNSKLKPMQTFPLIVELEVDGSSKKEYALDRCPLGALITDAAPLTIQEVHKGGYAESLKLKDRKNDGETWVIKKIGETKCDSADTQRQMDGLHEGLAALMPWSSRQ